MFSNLKKEYIKIKDLNISRHERNVLLRKNIIDRFENNEALKQDEGAYKAYIMALNDILEPLHGSENDDLAKKIISHADNYLKINFLDQKINSIYLSLSIIHYFLYQKGIDRAKALLQYPELSEELREEALLFLSDYFLYLDGLLSETEVRNYQKMYQQIRLSKEINIEKEVNSHGGEALDKNNIISVITSLRVEDKNDSPAVNDIVSKAENFLSKQPLDYEMNYAYLYACTVLPCLNKKGVERAKYLLEHPEIKKLALIFLTDYFLLQDRIITEEEWKKYYNMNKTSGN